eukprot:4145760-Pyramimonas_sp.AAC.1
MVHGRHVPQGEQCYPDQRASAMAAIANRRTTFFGPANLAQVRVRVRVRVRVCVCVLVCVHVLCVCDACARMMCALASDQSDPSW